MRDVLLTVILFGMVPFILKRPALGIILWVWVSVMNPHRLTYGFAYNLPFAQVIAISTLFGMVFSVREKRSLPITPVTVTLFLFVLWMNVTMLFALDFERSISMWQRVMKIQFMVFVALYVLNTKQHVQMLVWVMALSVAFFGVKGGIFTLVGGGSQRVWGPDGSFIYDNNQLALATIMTVPLLRYLQIQATRRWLWWALGGSMALCFLSALGSQSRGALLAIGAMLGWLWLKSRAKVATGVVLLVLVPIAIGFMPQQWMARMQTIQTYDSDASTLGRFNAWWMAFNLAKDRPVVGGGFEIYVPHIFGRYAPNPTDLHSAHSIYFQVLGEHGWVGLGLFLLLGLLVWRDASWILKNARQREGWQWASDLAAMIQVSLAGFAVGGAFLNLAYYDVPYNMLVALVVTRVLLQKEIGVKSWNEGVARDPGGPPGWGSPRDRQPPGGALGPPGRGQPAKPPAQGPAAPPIGRPAHRV